MKKIYNLQISIFNLVLFITILVFLSGKLAAQVVSTTNHPFDYGTGSEGAYISPNGTSTLSGVHNYTDFTIATGDTVKITGATPLIIKCTGTATINGVLFAKGDSALNVAGGSGTPSAGGNTSNGGGAAGGSGGGGGSNGVAGKNFGTSSGGGGNGTPTSFGGYGGAGGGYGQAGFSSISAGGSVYGDAGLTTVMGGTNILGGSGGGGGGGKTGASIAGAGGGQGGGAFCITANSIFIGANGLLTVRGGKGGQMANHSSSDGGAGGGGSGGTILLQYQSSLTGATAANTNIFGKTGFTIDIAGGTGGIYYGGQAGGYGRYLTQKDSSLGTCNSPTLTAKANNTALSINVCSGTSVSLTANPSGGSGCTGNTEFSWSDGSNYWNGISFTSAVPLFNTSYNNINTAPGSNTIYLVTIRCSADTTCNNSGTVSVTLSQPPSVTSITPGQTKCSGDSIMFTVNATGAPVLTYQWVKNGSAISGATNSTYIINSLNTGDAGNYNVIVTGGGTCNSQSDSNSVASDLIVNEIPVAGTITTSNDTVCSGTVAHLNLSGSTGNTFQWQSADSTLNFSDINGATSNTYVSTVLTHDTYYRVIVGNGNCTAATLNVKIKTLAAPAANFTDSISNKTVTFNSDGSTGAATFSWNFGDGKSGSQPNPVHTYINDSTYHVCLTVTNSSNCNFTSCKDIDVIGNGINNNYQNNVELYPVPVADKLFVTTNRKNDIKDIWVYDLPGRLVLYKNLLNLNNETIQVDLSDLTQGVYYIKIRTIEGERIMPVMKK